MYMYNAHSTQWYMYVSLNSIAISIIPIHYTMYMYAEASSVVCEVVPSAVVLEPQLMTCNTLYNMRYMHARWQVTVPRKATDPQLIINLLLYLTYT